MDFNDFKRFENNNFKKYWYKWSEKELNAKVLIIGIGGLGCPLLTYLAASGVGKIGIVDFDKVEISNLNRQTLFSNNDIGKFKVDQAQSIINKTNKKISVKIFKKKINSSNIKPIISGYDIICDGTDNFDTRYLINDECKKNKKILISARLVNLMVIYISSTLKKNHLVTDVLCLKSQLLRRIVKLREFFLQLQAC